MKAARTPKTIDEYLSKLSADKRAALQRLRRSIHAAAPKAEECISYQVPGFRLDGRLLVSFGAAAKHCSFYPGAVVADFKRELARYGTSKGTIRFPADKPLPDALVRRIVKAQIERHAARQKKRASAAARRR